MLNPIFEGFLLGLTLAILFGPAFFALIQTSINRGFRAGFFMALGIFLSDFTLVVITYFGLTNLIDFEHNHLMLGIIGGIILIILGTITFMRKPAVYNDVNAKLSRFSYLPNPLKQILKGFILNMFNPFLLIWWMTIVVGVSSNYGNDHLSIYAFFSSVLLTVLITDIIKVYISGRLKKIIKPELILWINKFVGILLILFGIILLLRVIIDF